MQYIHIIVVVSMAGDHTSAALFYYLKIIKIITLSTKPNSHNDNTLHNKKSSITINPFVANVPFLYTLKTSENFSIFWCFQGVEKEVHWEQIG